MRSVPSYRIFERGLLFILIIINLSQHTQVVYKGKTFSDKGLPNSCIRKATKISLEHCAGKTVIAAQVTSSTVAGVGHRLTEIFYLFRFAILYGYCFCFDEKSFDIDTDIYELVLESFIPNCNNYNLPKEEISWKKFEHFHLRSKVLQNRVYFIVLTDDIVWPRNSSETPKEAESVYSFIDNFLQHHCLIKQRILPWYLNKRKLNVKLDIDFFDQKSVKVVFHLRVGDMVLETSPNYWKNLIMTIKKIVIADYGHNVLILAFFTFFQFNHRTRRGRRMRKILQMSDEKWNNTLHFLPSSHTFIADICKDENLKCFWKSGCSLLESIDMYMTFDYVYLSGSSFSRTLGIFSEGVKIISKSKEIGDQTSPFLQKETASFSNTAYYHVNSDGELYDEQLAYLRL